MKGVIKFFVTEKGWGFICSEEKDYFFHWTSIKNQATVYKGQEVDFELVETVKGKMAVDVRLQDKS